MRFLDFLHLLGVCPVGSKKEEEKEERGKEKKGEEKRGKEKRGEESRGEERRGEKITEDNRRILNTGALKYRCNMFNSA